MQKRFDNIQHPVLIKKKKTTLNRTWVKRIFLEIVMIMYHKPRASITLNSEKL